MRASHVVLLSLAASTAVPVFAAPVPNLNARSEDGRASLSARNSPGHDCTEGKSDHALKIVDRDVPRDVNPGSLAARVTTEDVLKAMLYSRDLSTRQDLQARGLFDMIKLGWRFLNNFVRRDVTSDELAARDDADDLLKLIIGSRDSSPERRMQARDDGLAKLISILASRRDVAPDGLAARDDLKDFINLLNARSDIDDPVAPVKPKHANRESSPQQETKARRDDNAANDFLKALLNARDLSRRFTADDVLGLASRALDDLD